jgi:hypothetical protein
MKLNYFGPGPYLEFFKNGTVLSRGDDVLDCAARQGDSQAIIDVCMNPAGGLKFGADGDAEAYVANVIIPARQYKTQTVVDGAGSPVLNEDGSEQLEQVVLPLDMGQVVGNLWTIPEQKNENEEEI